MVVELGLFALVISCLLATAQAFFGLAGAHYGNRPGSGCSSRCRSQC